MSKIKNLLNTIIIPVGISVIVAPVFLAFIGTKILNNEEYNKESRFLFLWCMSVGQIVYSLLSTSTLGLIWLPILDGFFLFERIQKKLFSIKNDLVFVEQIILLCVSTISTTVMALCVFIFRLGKYFLKIPASVDLALGLYTGIFFTISPIALFEKEQNVYSILKISLQTVVSVIDRIDCI